MTTFQFNKALIAFALALIAVLGYFTIPAKAVSFFLGTLIIIALTHYVRSNYMKWMYSKPYIVPDPGSRRTNLRIGYYSCKENQVAETKDHVNFLMESQFNGPDKCLQNILDFAGFTILDVDFQVFYKPNEHAKRIVKETAEKDLTDFFIFLRDNGALKYVKRIYPVDEPNNTVQDLAQLRTGVEIIRRVASQFSELNDVRYMTTFAADCPFMGQDLFDDIGFDLYDMHAHILKSNQYKQLVASLNVNQRIVLVPGVCYGEDPTPFVNYAQTHPEVSFILLFLWFDDTSGSVGTTGVRSKPKQIELCREACLSVLGSSPK